MPIETSLNSSVKNNEPHTEEITLKDIILNVKVYLKYLKSKWLILLIAIAVGGGLGYFYAASKRMQYKAELTFVLEEEKSSGSLGLGSIAGQFGLDMGGSGGAFSGDNLLSLMKSRSLVKHSLLKKIKVHDRYITLAQFYLEINKDEDFVKKLKKRQVDLSNANYSTLGLNENYELDVIYTNLLQNDLLIDMLDKKTTIMRIKVISPNEVFSKTFTESLAEEVSDFYIITKTKKSADNVKVLQKQTDSVRRQLNAAISGVAISVDINPNANPSRQILKVPSQRKQVDIEANKAILTELVKNLELARVSLRKETPLIQIIDSPTYPLPMESFGKIKGALLGIIMFGFFTVLVLVLKKIFSDVMA